MCASAHASAHADAHLHGLHLEVGRDVAKAGMVTQALAKSAGKDRASPERYDFCDRCDDDIWEVMLRHHTGDTHARAHWPTGLRRIPP